MPIRLPSIGVTSKSSFRFDSKVTQGVKGKQATCPYSLTIPKEWVRRGELPRRDGAGTVSQGSRAASLLVSAGRTLNS